MAKLSVPATMPLQPLDEQNQSPLFRRRANTREKDQNGNGFKSKEGSASPLDVNRNLNSGLLKLNLDMQLGPDGKVAICSRCNEGFSSSEKIVNSGGEVWHPRCFVCAQCFQPFPDGVFYEFEGRKYCEHDFQVLYAPCCNKCGEFVIGRVIKAMNTSWHPDCFHCQLCDSPLADTGFVRNMGRALCRDCNLQEKASSSGKYVCHKCHMIIEEGYLKLKGDVYHPYHFNCAMCSTELTPDAREKNGELLCLRCHDKAGVPICGACRRPIEGRVINALGKTWHPEHFVCAKCEKPFHGSRHYERRNLAYCQMHFHQLFGDLCFVCNNVIPGDVCRALNKCWCFEHFSCSVCDRQLTEKTKFFVMDVKPVCKHCFEKFPGELQRRLKKASDASLS
ncbi:LIM and senescent cell antigen-like-containing domain protein 1 isoform X2 [Watersipora subatra]|uniref:LIM and senescent cell antigen-like-containing domain protein 1 isoform X2 n=1 Tax=Watersipora subatra TaxID=2589382 RepID=UPI00355BF5FE